MTTKTVNNVTSGTWTAIKGKGSAYNIYGQNGEIIIANMCPTFEETEGNTELILAAVNACKQINPSNPLAVAKALPEMLAYIKEMAKRYEKSEWIAGEANRILKQATE